MCAVSAQVSVMPNFNKGSLSTPEMEENFERKSNRTAVAVCRSFRSLVRGFLDYNKGYNYRETVQSLLQTARVRMPDVTECPPRNLTRWGRIRRTIL
jgi:hypothetical protein